MCEWPNTTAATSGKRRRIRSSRPAAGPGVVDHPDADVAEDRGVDERQPRLQLGRVDVPPYRVHRRPQALQHLQHGELHEVARVEDRVRVAQAREARGGERPPAARHVRVGDDRDARQRIRSIASAAITVPGLPLQPPRDRGEPVAQRAVREQPVQRAAQLVARVPVRRQADPEAELVHPLRVVVLVPEQRQQHGRLAEVQRLGGRVVAAVGDDRRRRAAGSTSGAGTPPPPCCRPAPAARAAAPWTRSPGAACPRASRSAPSSARRPPPPASRGRDTPAPRRCAR